MSTARKPWMRLLGVVLSSIALAWAAWLLAGAVEAGADITLRINPWAAVGAFALLACSLLVSLPAFWYVMRSIGMGEIQLFEFAHYHFASQLMKHLPARFLGIVYQASAATHLASAMQWVQGNVVLAAMTVAFSILVPALVLGILGAVDWRLCALVALAIVMPFMAVRSRAHSMQALPTVGGFKGRLTTALAALGASLHSRHVSPALAWFMGSWIIYLAAWVLLGVSIEGVGAKAGLELCAWYTVAWAIGFLTLITPSGLGVRELAFTLMASRFDGDVIAIVAIAARMGLIAADLLLAVVFLYWRRNG